MDVTCDTCGAVMAVGEWPFCPHGRGVQAVHADDVPGGFVVENGFEQPRKFYSKSEHERALKAEGCEIRAKWAGPGDRYLTRWDIPDAYTLEAAKVLLTRGRPSRQAEPAPDLPTDAIETADTGQTFTVRAS